MPRTATIHRITKETDIRLRLAIDGRGKSKISTGIRFFDHMLDLVARHGGVVLPPPAKGGLRVDPHHTLGDGWIPLCGAVQKTPRPQKGILPRGYFLFPKGQNPP